MNNNDGSLFNESINKGKLYDNITMSEISLQKDLEEFSEQNKKTIIYKCKNCSDTILINNIIYYNQQLYLECDCLCSKIINLKIEDLDDEYRCEEEINNNRIIKSNNYTCNVHENISKFEYYCEDCESNICSECIGEVHINHTLIDFNGDYITKVINTINDNEAKIINEKDSNSINNEFSLVLDNLLEKDRININLLFNLLKYLIIMFKEYSCYNYYKSIINVIEKISNLYKELINNNKNKKNNIDNIYIKKIDELDKIIKKKIRYPRELNSNCDYEKILSINVIKKSFDIKIIEEFRTKKLENLEKISLRENNLKSIEPLINIEFPNLKYLNLGKNRLDNKNIEYLCSLNVKNLKYLNIFENNITDPQVFHIPSHLKTIKLFYLGCNKLIFNKNSNDKYDLGELEEIGLSGGVFSKNTINLIQNIYFNKLKILYLNCCNIDSLNFVNKLYSPCLEEIWFMNNYIDNFMPLIKYKKTMKIINLKNNKISDISNIENFIDKFEKLEKITLSENLIDFNLKENRNIIININSKNIKLDIYY